MAENLSISAGISSRYSTALFELMLEEGMLEELEGEIAALQQVIKDSEDIRVLIASPIYTRDDARRGIVEIATRMGLSNLFTNITGTFGNQEKVVCPAANTGTIGKNDFGTQGYCSSRDPFSTRTI